MGQNALQAQGAGRGQRCHSLPSLRGTRGPWRSAARPAVRFGVTRGSGARVLGHLGSRRGTARGAGYPRRRYSHLLMGTHVAWRVEERQARCPHTRGNGPGMQAHGASAGGRDTTHLRLARGQYFVYSRAVCAENHLVEGGEELWRRSTGASRGATESSKASAMRRRLSTETLRWPCSMSQIYEAARRALAASARWDRCRCCR